jgi:hypothetical protein
MAWIDRDLPTTNGATIWGKITISRKGMSGYNLVSLSSMAFPQPDMPEGYPT